MKKNKVSFKYYSITFLTIFILFVIFTLSYNIDFLDTNHSLIAKILFFSRFIEEYIAVIIILNIIYNKYIKLISIGYLLVIFYILINIYQVVCFIISGSFLTKLAIDNIEFFPLIASTENIIIVLYVLIFLLLVPTLFTFLLKNLKTTTTIFDSKYVLIFLLIIGTALNHNVLKSGKYILERDLILTSKKFKHTAPVQAFIGIFQSNKTEDYKFSYNEIKELEELGFHFNPFNRYPFKKKHIYKKDLKFNSMFKFLKLAQC